MHLFLDKLKDSINLDHSRNALERQQLKYSFEKRVPLQIGNPKGQSC
jgi:hypothetical protein